MALTITRASLHHREPFLAQLPHNTPWRFGGRVAGMAIVEIVRRPIHLELFREIL